MTISEIKDDDLKTIVTFANAQGWYTTLYNNEEGQYRIRLSKKPNAEEKRSGGRKIWDAIEKDPEAGKALKHFLEKDKSFYSPYNYKVKGDSFILSHTGRID